MPLSGGREVVISRRAGEAVLRGAPVFVPGVLAVSSGVARGNLVVLAVARDKPGRYGTVIAVRQLRYGCSQAAGWRTCR